MLIKLNLHFINVQNAKFYFVYTWWIISMIRTLRHELEQFNNYVKGGN